MVNANLAPKHARKHEAHPPRVKQKCSVSIQTIWAGVSNMVTYKTSDVIWVVCNKLTTIWAPTKKLLVSWQFSGPYGPLHFGRTMLYMCIEYHS